MEDVTCEGLVLLLFLPVGFVLRPLGGIREGGLDFGGNGGEEVLHRLLRRCGRLVGGGVLETDADSQFIELADTGIYPVGF